MRVQPEILNIAETAEHSVESAGGAKVRYGKRKIMGGKRRKRGQRRGKMTWGVQEEKSASA